VAKWQPRMTPETEAALSALGPYLVTHSGHLLWDPAPGFGWPWGAASLDFAVHPRHATDADYRRLLGAWRQVCGRREAVLAVVRGAIRDSWAWAAENIPPAVYAADPDAPDEAVFGHVRGGHFALATGGPGQVAIEVYAAVAWDEEHGVRIDLVDPDERLSWSFD
jgi:hypothetical protein